jgi:four helix bundle protein
MEKRERKEESNKKPIRSFGDLEVYKRLYAAMLIVLKEIAPKLPEEEKYGLRTQMRRCCKSSPALLAEGFAKRYQQRSWKKYLEDARGECNEMIHHLGVCIDAYNNYIDAGLCQKMVETYDIANRQLYNLQIKWKDFNEKR